MNEAGYDDSLYRTDKKKTQCLDRKIVNGTRDLEQTSFDILKLSLKQWK